MFVGFHMLLAERTKTPEWAITPEEGNAFMASAQNVMRHYSVEATQKTLDWIAFAGCAGGIYVPRFIAMSVNRQTAKRENPPANANANGAANPDQPFIDVTGMLDIRPDPLN